ncbi:subunit of tubulin prefoldin [Rhizophlyctis rosea]|uniref:Subunit of tubulin prefoldin n=1 Tax=Rhizophlyctis rosea TaxID=64517 RepID=A0AAD5SLY3_9FUNG|nr:subunit of tubulin prefoldin [Rhizophlyctis rosea]
MAQNTQIDPLTAPLQQLQMYQQRLQEDIETLTTSYASLRTVQAKYNDCLDSLKVITSENRGKTVLVPLTNSLYVPGELSDVESVIVDVGTGYFVDKPIPDAKDYYKRKVDYIQTNLNGLQGTITEERKKLTDISELIALRVEMQRKQAAETKK